MPPKRKALDTADPNVKPAAKTNKKAKSSPDQPEDLEAKLRRTMYEEALKHRAERWSTVSGSKNWDADYLHRTMLPEPGEAYKQKCVCNPADNQDEWDEDEEDQEEEGGQDTTHPVKCDSGKTCNCGKTASEAPSHPCTVSQAGLSRNGLACGLLSLRDPDSFGMHTYNDHKAYGAAEVVENMLIDFDDTFKEKHWREAWAIAEGMALFLFYNEGDVLYTSDDGEGVNKIGSQVVRMFLTALTMLEQAEKLTPDLEVKNISWIMSLYLKMVEEMQSMGLLEETPNTKQKTFKFYAGCLDFYLRSYAARQAITVPGLDESSEEDDKLVMPDLTKKDPFSWSNSFSTFKTPSIGGDRYDVTTMKPAERKKSSYDGKDPLQGAAKKLKEGLVLDLA